MPLSAGTHLSPYQIVALLGAGGMGEVYRAHDPRLGRDVAIRCCRGHSLPIRIGFGASSKKPRAAAALNHPNILAVYDLGTHDGAPYVVSELLAGTTLRDALAMGPLPVRKAVDYAMQIANGLADSGWNWGGTHAGGFDP